MEPVDIVIPRRRALRDYLLCSPPTAWRREKSDPTWPKPILIGPGRHGYRLSDIRYYLDSLKPDERAIPAEGKAAAIRTAARHDRPRRAQP